MPDRSPPSHPLRLLALLVGGALAVLAALAGRATADGWPLPTVLAPAAAGDDLRQPHLARADTDTVKVRPDSLALDSLALDSLALDALGADTLAWADTGRAALYLPRWRLRSPLSAPFPHRRGPLLPPLGRYWQTQVVLDSTQLQYVARERVGELEVRRPLFLDYDAFRLERLRKDLDDNWRELTLQRERARTSRQAGGGLGFNIVVPGGRQSAFTTIFGKPDVSLRVTGQADIKAGFNYRKSDQQATLTGDATQVDPDFKQDLRLGITGGIGDKMRVDVNYDTQNQFDFQNQLKLQYTGYEDEIIQKIEAGNVFLQTPSQLIRGGQSLFGIKSELQLGGVRLTTVMSQEEGQANTKSIDGGAEAQTFEFKPTGYDEARHFFLSYFFRNRFEDALSDPPQIRVLGGFERITEVEVWKLPNAPLPPEELNARQVVAVIDLGENADSLRKADGFITASTLTLPDNVADRYTDGPGGEVETLLREGTVTPNDYLESLGMTSADFQVGRFKKLLPFTDYTFDPILGTLTLKQRLQDNEALGLAFRYTYNGRTRQVGDFSTDTGGSSGGQNEDRLVLKLIRPQQLRPPAPEIAFNPAAWYLELRNIYQVQGRNINANEFELQIDYEPPGQTASPTLPGVGGQQTLVQLLGLDRLNPDGAPRPDERFDYLSGITIDPDEGLIIFPYLQPFGAHLARLIDETAPPEQREDLKNLYVFRSLYSAKKINAQRETQFDVFRVHGSYKGAAEAFYDLQAFSGVVPGSVRVSSGGNALQEGSDYVVDYQAGTVSITNPSYLTAGRNVEISYEQNSFFNLQKKTLLGARADYKLDERFSLGATLMRLSQKSPIDKFRLGEEPIQNTIWGLDGSLLLEPRWLTRAVDALPLLQTKANSLLRFTGEFAQFRPGNTQTVAFERTQRDLRRNGRNFNSDEERGISYLDDFEGFENTFSFLSPGFWGLSPAPDSIGATDPTGVQSGGLIDSLRTTWRASLGWYQLNVNILEEMRDAVVDSRFLDAIDIVDINDVFPDRDTRAETDTRLQTFDLHFNPFERGPYNYSTRLQDFFANPHLTWGGIMQRVPEGYNDFTQKNIDFVEFVFKPIPENDARDAGDEARLYVDLGAISEDLLPNKRPNPNNEDGLSLTSIEPTDLDTWGRLPKGSINGLVDIDEATRRTEDLGLDGLPSYEGDYPAFATEQAHFAPFLAALDNIQSSDPRIQAEIAKARRDPSGDDYYNFADDYYNDRTVYPNGSTVQQRMSHYFPGHELNSYESQNQIAGGGRGNSRTPDTEDRNLNSTVDQDNSFFQYEIPLGRRALKELGRPEKVDDFIVGEIISREGDSTGWFLVRIPVQQYTRRTGSIQDFTSIQYMRLWTTGHRTPITMRFATLEFVGSQWQKSDRIALEGHTASDTLAEATRLTISSINNEENSDLYVTPTGTIISQTRLATGRQQQAREQALVLRVEDLRPGRQRGIFKPQNALDLLKYSNLRMFAHLHGTLGDGTDLTTLPKEVARERVRLFVRLGSSETNDYYEYEQPLTPGRIEGEPTSDELWQTNQDFGGTFIDLNSVNIELAALNQLKTARDRLAASDPQNVRTDRVFWNVNADTLVSPDVPDAERFAPPGTRLGIKGNPSLQKVNSIVIGIRNGADSTSTAFGDILEDVTVWVNELRVSGYDASTGWAGLANLNLKLADFIDLKANFQSQTDGFGSLSSTLGDRDQKTLRNWSVNGEVYLDKFIPERFGWQLPVSVQVQSNTTTPRFSPTRGDVRLDDLLAQIDTRSDLTAPERAVLKDEAIASAQTLSQTRSLTTRVSKQGSKSRLLRNTLDGITASYSLTQSDARNPSQSINDSWRWVANVGYRFSARKPRTLRPFWFLDGVPVASLLGDLRFNYLPQSITTAGSATRNLTTSQNRAVPTTTTSTSSLTRPLPDLVRYPVRETHQFTHARNFGLQYSPFGFLNLGFDTDTNQSLNAAGADTAFTVARFDTTGGAYTLIDLLPGLRFRDAVAQGLVTPQDSAVTAFELTRLSLLPGGQVLNTLFSGGDGLRTERYQQRFTGTFSPRLNRIRALNWFNLQDISYSVQYQWDNGAVGRNTGADISNQIDLRGGLTLRPQEFWRKFDFYRNLEDAQRRIDQEKQAKRQRKEDERRRRKAAREQDQNPQARPPAPSEGQRNPNLPSDRRPPTAVPPRQEAPEEEDEELPTEEEELQEEGQEAELLDEEDAPVLDEEGAPDEDEQPAQPAEKQGGGGLKLPLPSPKGLLRRTVLAVTGIRDLSLTYSGTRGASSSNVGQPRFGNDGQLRGVETSYTLLDAFKGKGPSVRYRFGLEREVGVETRILDQTLQVADVLNNADRFQGRTSLNPSQSLTITLNWTLDRTTGRNLTFRPPDDPDTFGIDTTLTENGTNKASVWAFGASYLDLFQQQFDTYRRDLARAPIPDPLQLGDEDGNGRVVATNPTVVDDFRQAFLFGRNTLDSRNLLPFPFPNWTVSYAGLGKWPLLRRLVQNATLRHSYSADYSNDFATNTIAEAGAVASFPLGATQIEYLAPRYVTNSVRLNERYQPFLGVDLTWKGNLQTNVSWNRSNTWSLSASNLEVSENKTNDLSATINFQKTGLKLPFIRNKLQNRASIGLTVTRSQTSDQRYLLKRALEQAAINPDFVAADALTGDNILRVTGHNRLTLQPQVSYQFSNRVSANFTLKYEQFNSEDNRQPSSTNVEGTFNIRISIQN
jgi:cell surface protein SprA